MPQAPEPPRARQTGALGVVLGVLALHALLLSGWPVRPEVVPQPETGSRAMQVRVTVAPTAAPAVQVEPQAQAPAGPPPAAPSAADQAPSPAGARGRAVRTAAPPNPTPPAGEAAQAPPEPAAQAATETATETATQRATQRAAAADPSDDEPATLRPTTLPAGLTVPTYPTRLPPAFVLTYQAHRPGPQQRSGTVELAWRPEGDRYTLSLGNGLLGSTSTGTLDGHGVAPERQADTRRTREVRAVNFQRDAGRITYSGPQVEHPLLPGVQDRLSWLVQLAGVLSADATLAESGRSVQLYVTGPRGDAAVWTFTVAGPDSVDLPDGSRAAALRLVREPEGLHDPRVELWTDPARHHLPLRLRLQARAATAATEFILAGGTRTTP